MKIVALGKVVNIDRTVATDDECKTLPFVGLEHIEKDAGHFINEFVPTPLNMLATNFRFTPKHVLYGKLRPYLNKVVLPSFDGVCTTEVLPLLPNENELDRTFLWAILMSPAFVSWASSQISGANLPRLDPKLLSEYKLPLPPLPVQRRIATILSRADCLRRLRRTARELGEQFLQSVFMEMYGEQTSEPLFALGEVVKVDRKIATKEDCFRLPYIGLEHIEKDKGKLVEDFQMSPQSMLATNFRFTTQHVLYGKLRPYLNKVLLPSFDGVCTTEILPLLPVEGKIVREYLWVYLMSKSFVDWASSNVAGANLPRLAPNVLAEFPIPVPIMATQQKFAGIVQDHARLRNQQREAERQAEMLFQSLLQQAFTGELKIQPGER